MSVVLKWVKGNVYIIVFVAIMIAAPVAMWVVAGGMNKAVRAEVEARAKKISDMSRFEKTSVAFSSPVPGNEPVKASIAVNRQFLDRYQQVVAIIRADADRVKEEVLRINHKNRDVLVPELFPRPPSQLRETLPQNMSRALQGAYEQLLSDVGAGGPPTRDEMVEHLTAARERYLTQLLKRSTDTLTEDEQAGLTEQLTKTRLSYYADAAKGLKMYATTEDLNVPAPAQFPDRAENQGMIDMFDWEWRLWVKQDILMALAKANEPYNSIVDAPVKRVVSIYVQDVVGAGAGGGDAGTGGFSAPGGKRRRGDKGSSGGGAPKGGRPNASREIPLDYNVSFTGRATNPLFDVRRVRVVLIIDSERLPEAFDALAKYNFMTITNARVEPEGLFLAIREGYFYGSKPVSRVTLELETIWFREWTTQFMPLELKQALGIPVEAKSTG
jgi:hypothetical protein